MNNGKIFEEATGIFVGELLEDMIETVARTKKLYCNVYIPAFYARNFDHPLTYVPLWAMSLPLRKGDKVLVEFHQGDLTLPVLYKNSDEIDKEFYEKFEFPDFVKGTDGGNIDKPEAVDTIGSTKLGENSFVIKTDNYTVFHQNNGFILIDKEDKIYVYGSEINIVSTGKTNVDSASDINVFTKGTVKLEGKSDINLKNDGKLKIQSESDISLETNANVSVKANRTGKISVETQMGEINIKAGSTAAINLTSGAQGVSINNHLKVMM